MCERCNAEDGRHVAEYAIKGRTAHFCDDCARLTAAVHDISPEPPKAPEAEAAPAKDEEAPEAESAPTKKARKRA